MTSKAALHDYRRSRAVLIGTSDYRELQALPAASKSLERITNMLTSDLCGWPRERVSVFSNEPGPGDLPDKLITLFYEVRDVALFYFVGHGQVDTEDHLCLGLVGSRTEPHRRAATSLQFRSVRQALLGSPATTKIIILDCCFAGLANKPSNTLGTPTDLLDKTAGTGAYVMAACSSYETAWYEKRAKKEAQTYFTKYLADLIEAGIPGEPAALRIRVLFRQLRENLANDRCPLPEDRNVDAAGDFLFAHNAAPPQLSDGHPQEHPDEQLQLTQLRQMFVNLSRRSQSLVERQLQLIDQLEQREQDPERLSSLFQMDHLATRMRRYSENLLVLAGHDASRRWNQPVALVDVLRAAMSEIEQYERVILNVQPGIAVRGPAVGDIVHLTSELLENATSFSAPETPVTMVGHRLSTEGVLLEITDQGVGMGAEEMAHANWRLDNPPEVDVAISRRMGLFVVAQLAAKHDIRVRLRAESSGGVKALVWLPDAVTVLETDTEAPTLELG